MYKSFVAVAALVGVVGCGGVPGPSDSTGLDPSGETASAVGSTSAWHHARLRSKQAADISIDFTKSRKDVDYKPQTTVYADNVWVNVMRGDLDPSDTVKVVITNRDLFVGNSNAGYIQYYTETVLPLKLEPAENGRFTGTLPSSLVIDAWGYGGVNRITQNVELEINGVAQEDPVQAPHVPPYFNVDMSKTPAEQ